MRRIKSEFGRNVLTLMTGTTIAQAFSVAIAPLVTRIFTPDDFGVFALYTAIVAVIGVVATGRYELAIVLPKEEEDALNIAVLSFVISVCIGMITFVCIHFFNDDIANAVGNRGLRYWLYLIPISVLLTGVYQTLSFWNNRNRRFKVMALASVSQTTAGGTTQLGIGYGTGISGGLVVGSVVGQSVGATVLLAKSWGMVRKAIHMVSLAELWRNARRYRQFPLFSSWGGLINTAAGELPVFLISNAFGIGIVGAYSLTMKVLNLPIALMSGAVHQVLLEKMASLQNKRPEELLGHVLQVAAYLALMTVPAMVILLLWGENLFTFAFGSEWSQAGSFASVLSIALGIRFIVSPLSAVMALAHNVKLGVLWQNIYFITIIITLGFASQLEIEMFLRIFVIHEVILYGLHFAMICWAAKRQVPIET